MVVAGTSSPASGGEHLLSHLWDMDALLAGQPVRLHGAQVGVATILSTALYQRLSALKRPVFRDPTSWETEEARIRADFGPLSEAVLPEARAKHKGSMGRICDLEVFWNEIREELTTFGIPTPDDVKQPLIRAGAPCTLADLGLSREDAHRALRIARDIRNRYTVLDLAYELGVFPAAIDDVIEDAGV